MTQPIFPSTLPSTTSPTSPRSRRVEREREREKGARRRRRRRRERERVANEIHAMLLFTSQLYALHPLQHLFILPLRFFFPLFSSLGRVVVVSVVSVVVSVVVVVVVVGRGGRGGQKKEFLFQLLAPFRQRVQNHRRSERHARARVTRFEPIEMFFFIRDERRRERERPEE